MRPRLPKEIPGQAGSWARESISESRFSEAPDSRDHSHGPSDRYSERHGTSATKVRNPLRSDRDPKRAISLRTQGAPLPIAPQPHSDKGQPDGLVRRSHPVETLLINTSEVAMLLNMSTSWVYREASKLGLKGYKLGRGRNAKILYKKTEVHKWLEQQKMH
ncbi:helix-turn-helix domain-containing protein [Streptomyces microflavus]|uniref:helix-turn-helix domain-containing protein n=1 Tax=Streptomyces microflavus TaxID=1919 RepID=UPI003821282D